MRGIHNQQSIGGYQSGTETCGNALTKLTSRSKLIGLKHHWFKSKLESGIIECHPVNTKLQKADIFTKG